MQTVLFSSCKNNFPKIWPKRPVRIVVWVEGKIRGCERGQESGKQCKAVPTFYKNKRIPFTRSRLFSCPRWGAAPSPQNTKLFWNDGYVHRLRDFSNRLWAGSSALLRLFPCRSFFLLSLSTSRIRSILAPAVSSSFISLTGFSVVGVGPLSPPAAGVPVFSALMVGS